MLQAWAKLYLWWGIWLRWRPQQWGPGSQSGGPSGHLDAQLEVRCASDELLAGWAKVVSVWVRSKGWREKHLDAPNKKKGEENEEENDTKSKADEGR